MDLQKTKIYLDKLNREFARMDKDPDNIMRIDKDIMASYVRELYDAILSHDSGHTAKQEAVAQRKPSPPRQVESPVEAPPPPAVSAPPVIVPQPVVVEAAPPPPAPVQEEAPAPALPPAASSRWWPSAAR